MAGENPDELAGNVKLYCEYSFIYLVIGVPFPSAGRYVPFEFKKSLTLESVPDQFVVLHIFLSMRRTDAQRRKVRAFLFKHSQSLARRRHRLSQPMVRSTTQRLGSTAKPLAASERLTISTFIFRRTCRKAWRNFGP